MCISQIYWNPSFLNLNSIYDNSQLEYIQNSMINQYIMIPNINLTNYNSLTIEIWTFLNNINSGGFYIYNQTLFFMGDNTNFLLFRPAFTSTSNGPLANFQIGNKSANFTLFGTDTETSGNWIYTAFSISSTESFVLTTSSYSLSIKNQPLSIPFDNQITGNIYIGYSPLNPNSNYSGFIGTLRIWNISLNSTFLENNYRSTLFGDEYGLIGYWMFDNCNSSYCHQSATFENDAILYNNPTSLTSQELESQSLAALPINIINRIINYNSQSVINFFNENSENITVISFPTDSSICLMNSTGCLIITKTNNSFFLSKQNFSIILSPQTRGICFNIQTYILESLQNVTVNIKVKPFQANLQKISSYINTTGGNLTLNGIFGLDGLLVSEENVKIIIKSISPNQNISCLNPFVSNNGQNLTCTVPPGIGFGQIEITVCYQTLQGNFSYYPPIIQSISGLNNTYLFIFGENFGINNSYIDYTHINIITENGIIPCDIANMTNNEIYCSTGVYYLSSPSNYSMNISIGGQLNFYNFTFNICDSPCLNGGQCVGRNICDCHNTGYYGSFCQYSLNCTCIPGQGTCYPPDQFHPTSYCVCAPSFSGSDCSQLINKKKNSAVIGGVVGAVVFVLIAGVGILIFFVKRYKKNQIKKGKNFIPLEKKDFTRVIYGEQLDQTPKKYCKNPELFEKLIIESINQLFHIFNYQMSNSDKISKCLLIIFEVHNKAIELLKLFMEKEIQATTSSGTLFRGNSMACKMFSFYARIIGTPYLYETIGPALSYFIEQEYGLEIDPEKIEEGADSDEIKWTLMGQCQNIMKSIYFAVDKCPVQFREILSYVKNKVTEKFPDSGNIIVGGFLFLRYFCPAISSPETFGIIDEPTNANSRRLLTLVAKVIQNLSNDVNFGSKESYMMKLNDFIVANRPKLAEYYEKLLKPINKSPTTCKIPPNVHMISIDILAEFIHKNIESIENPELKQKFKEIFPDNNFNEIKDNED